MKKKIIVTVITALTIITSSLTSFAAETDKPSNNNDIIVTGEICNHRLRLNLTLNGATYIDNENRAAEIVLIFAKEEDCKCKPQQFSGNINGIKFTKDTIEYFFNGNGFVEFYPDFTLDDIIASCYLLRIDTSLGHCDGSEDVDNVENNVIEKTK